MAHPYFELPTPIPIGHRGAAGEAPENTLASFERAVADGALILESDVHPTRDGAVVIFHDDELDRTTDGSGPIAQLTLAELRALDAGFHWTGDGGASFPFRGRGHGIPTLAETLEAFPNLRFNLEIKERSPGLIERTLDLVAGREERTLIAAADDAIMADLRAAVARRGAKVAIGASAGDVIGFVRAALDGAPPPPGPMALQVPPDFGGRALVTPRFVEHAHAHGLHVHVWTVNEPDEIERLLDLGVDGVMSDFPARVVAAIGARARRRR
jgi:glycerophosphoryl diester phosphodiesterase